MAQKSTYGQKDYLTTEHYEEIDEELKRFIGITNAKLILLSDTQGQLLSIQGAFETKTLVKFAALTLGAFMASCEMTGSPSTSVTKHSLKTLLLEGDETNIYIKQLAESLLLISVFSEPATIGGIKTNLKTLSKQLITLFKSPANTKDQHTVDVHKFDPEFEVGIRKQLDDLFDKSY